MIGHNGSSQSLKNVLAGFWFNCKKASVKKLGKNKSMHAPIHFCYLVGNFNTFHSHVTVLLPSINDMKLRFYQLFSLIHGQQIIIFIIALTHFG